VALKNPGNIDAAVSLTTEHFRFGVGNGISEDHSDELFDKWAIPSPGRPYSSRPAPTSTRTRRPRSTPRTRDRGPLLPTMGGKDHTVPEAVSQSTYKQYRHSQATTHLTEFADRGHSLTIDHAWRENADSVLSWPNANGIRDSQPLVRRDVTSLPHRASERRPNGCDTSN
jgi:hypothetical protein